jgi:general secretion pathway protein K
MRVLRQEKGMVLLLVLVVVALLSALLTEWAFSTHVDMRLTETFRDSTRAWYLAKGGVQAGRMILQNDTNAWAHPSELWGQGIPGYPIGENGSVSIDIEDLEGKLNLNTLVDANGNPNTVMIRRLYRLLDLLALAAPGDLTAAVVDWVDKDGDVYDEIILEDNSTLPVAGAEGSYYQGLTSPYPAANGPLNALDELSMVRGFTPEVMDVVFPYLSVNGTTSLNLNTAGADLLQAWDRDVSPRAVEEILNARAAAPLESTDDVKNLLTLNDWTALNRNLDVSVASNTFRITAIGRVGDGARQVMAVVSGNGKDIYYMKVD